MTRRYVCIHGHFYQPPRENPWLEAIEHQDEAYPYHDWNELINAESYGPNADARILDPQRRIVRIVNNYASINFDFGPTLLSWLEQHARDTYRAVLDADRVSARHFHGHGSAMAQAYNHVIMPLANARDRHTQVVWGLYDFEHRFGRPAEGMWLPETAVDMASLEELAAAGIRYTVLAPHQASAVRRLGEHEWLQVDARIDTTQPYLCRLPSGRELAVFFYDGPASRAVAFEGLLKNGELLAQRLLTVFNGEQRLQLSHIATDGETYGHHHRHGEMALAYAIHHIESNSLATITNYGEFLELQPPRYEVTIAEITSWSCAHGVERWRSDCGCHTGGQPGWRQEWRAPLREALEWLRDELAARYERAATPLLGDAWTARDEYIEVVIDRAGRQACFLDRRLAPGYSEADAVRALKLLELQRHALLMFTSCGWFFNEVSGIETVQVMQYAARAMQLAVELFQADFEPEFMRRLERAPSNLAELGNARRVYEQRVLAVKVDLLSVAAHYAVNSLFADQPAAEQIYSYQVALEQGERLRSGETSLSVGRARVCSDATRECAVVTFAILHFGAHHLTGGIRRFLGSGEYDALTAELLRAFHNGDIAAVVRLLAHFPEYSFSLKSLFSDRQREVLYRLLQGSVKAAEEAYRRVYENNLPLTRFLANQDLPLPRAFTLAAEFVLNQELRTVLESDDVDLERPRALLSEASAIGVTLDLTGLSFALQRTLERLAEQLRRKPEDSTTLQRVARAATLARSLPLGVDLWRAQNSYYRLLKDVYPDFNARARAGDLAAREWIDLFTGVGEQLGMAVQ
jgi:alpha-amylase/alpha-mannosidase (GH57 family)